MVTHDQNWDLYKFIPLYLTYVNTQGKIYLKAPVARFIRVTPSFVDPRQCNNLIIETKNWTHAVVKCPFTSSGAHHHTANNILIIHYPVQVSWSHYPLKTCGCLDRVHIVMCTLPTNFYQQQRNISSRFSEKSEAKASYLPANLQEMFSLYHVHNN